MSSSRSAGGGGHSWRSVVIAAVLTFTMAGAAFAIASPSGTGGLNNGGKSTSGGNSSCFTDVNCGHNPGEVTKSCTPVPGNGCHALPDTPCDRGHGGTQMHNKHCGPAQLAPTPT